MFDTDSSCQEENQSAPEMKTSCVILAVTMYVICENLQVIGAQILIYENLCHMWEDEPYKILKIKDSKCPKFLKVLRNQVNFSYFYCGSFLLFFFCFKFFEFSVSWSEFTKLKFLPYPAAWTINGPCTRVPWILKIQFPCTRRNRGLGPHPLPFYDLINPGEAQTKLGV